MSTPPPNATGMRLTPYSACTWICSISPVLVGVTILALTLVFSLRMDGALPHLLEVVMMLSYVFAMFFAPLAWVVFVLIRDFRLSPRTHLLQIGVFVVGWILTVPLFALLESQHLPGWFLD